MAYEIPDHYPDPRVKEINLGTEMFHEELPPHVPLFHALGETLVRASGPVAETIARRALLKDGEWTLDHRFSISVYKPSVGGGNGDSIIVVVKKQTEEGPLRDYYQCAAENLPAYAASLMSDRPDKNPDEQWFISVVNNPDLAKGFEENGVGPFSRAVCERIDQRPPELECYGMPDSVNQSDLPSSDLFETTIDLD